VLGSDALRVFGLAEAARQPEATEWAPVSTLNDFEGVDLSFLAGARLTSNEPTLDQLLAEPIVQQLMRRDRIDEGTIRHLMQKTGAARPAVRAENDLDADAPPSMGRLPHETARPWCGPKMISTRALPLRWVGCRTRLLGRGAVLTIERSALSFAA
jgi:hypothetical protein